MLINEKLFDDSISHMVWSERFKTSVSNKVLAVLNSGDKELQVMLIEGLLALEGSTTKKLAKAITAKREALIDKAYAELLDELNEFAVYESQFQIKLIEASIALEASYKLSSPKRSELKKPVVEKAFRGRILSEWFEDLKATDSARIVDALRVGIADGQTNSQIVRNIIGTKKLKYNDGILNMSRRNANTVVRTAISHVADSSSQLVWENNTDIIKGLKWVSTLDTRTTEICRTRDGKVYAVDKAPPIPAHWGCRSRKVPYLGHTNIKGTRASQFGQVPDDLTYGAWLKKQPLALQQEVLGVKKAKLFREGGLKIDRFSDPKGRAYTLDELKQRDSETWNKVFK